MFSSGRNLYLQYEAEGEEAGDILTAVDSIHSNELIFVILKFLAILTISFSVQKTCLVCVHPIGSQRIVLSFGIQADNLGVFIRHAYTFELW